MNTEYKIKIMQAYIDGKRIEFRPPIGGRWCDVALPKWDWVSREYRIKAAIEKATATEVHLRDTASAANISCHRDGIDIHDLRVETERLRAAMESMLTRVSSFAIEHFNVSDFFDENENGKVKK